MRENGRRLGIFKNIAPETPVRAQRKLRPPPGFEAVEVKSTAKNVKQTAPVAFVCPLSKQLMRNPVCISSGEVYEKAEILNYFAQDQSGRSPSGKKLKNLDVIELPTMKMAITAFIGQLKTNFLEIPYSEIEIQEATYVGSKKTVYRGTWHGILVAVMRFKTERDSSDSFEVGRSCLEDLLDIYRYLGRHPNLITFFGITRNTDDFITTEKTFLVTDWAPHGSLHSVIERRAAELPDKRAYFSNDVLLALLGQIIAGMETLATLDIVHRDLSCKSILVFDFDPMDAARVHVKISGFDQSKRGTVLQEVNGRLPLRWSAPETLKSHRNTSEKSDVYSFGVVVWEILNGRNELPYAHVQYMDEDTLRNDIISGSVSLSRPANFKIHEGCNILSDEFWRIVTMCTHTESKKRPTFKMLGLLVEEIKTKLIVEKCEAGIREEERLMASKREAKKTDAIIQELKGKVARLESQLKLATWGDEGVRQRAINTSGSVVNKTKSASCGIKRNERTLLSRRQSKPLTIDTSKPAHLAHFDIKGKKIAWILSVFSCMLVIISTFVYFDFSFVSIKKVVMQNRHMRWLIYKENMKQEPKYHLNSYVWIKTHRPRLGVVLAYDVIKRKYTVQMYKSNTQGNMKVGSPREDSSLMRDESGLRIVHPKLMLIVHDIPTILKILAETKTDTSLASQCCLIIAEHATDALERKNIVVNYSGHQILVNMIQTLLHEAIFVRWAVLALSNLCDEHTILTLATKETLNTLKQSLRRYNDNHKIVSVVCVSLGNLAHSDQFKSMISSDKDLIQHLVNVMNKHIAHSEVQHRCSYAVGKIASGSSENRRKFILHGVLRALAFALHAYPTNENIIKRIGFAVEKLAFENTLAQVQILRAGLLQLMVAAMRSNSKSSIVQLFCCRALHAIVYRNADARTAAVQHNALAAVTDALAKFHSDSNLQKSCNVAMDAIFPTASSSFYSGVNHRRL